MHCANADVSGTYAIYLVCLLSLLLTVRPSCIDITDSLLLRQQCFYAVAGSIVVPLLSIIGDGSVLQVSATEHHCQCCSVYVCHPVAADVADTPTYAKP